MTVLLTDGVTHHYTIVYSIDQSGSFMDLLDPWPNRIFLRRGLNRKRVDAKIIEVPNKGKLVRITRDEFERVVLGAVGHEQVSFHAHLVDLVPASRKNQRFLLALAITTFGPAPQETPQPALPYFKEALDLARADAGSVLTRHIASESLYLIYVTSYLTKSDDIPELEREAIIRTLGDIAGIVQELAPDMQVASSLKEEQLIRLGQLAWEANENGESEHIFSTVIQRFPNNPAGYFGRAKAQNRLLKHTGTIDDVTHALGLLKALLDSDTIPLELKKGSSAYKILDYFDSAQERKNLHFMLTESYFLRGNAYNALGKYPEAEQDGREAIKFNPQNHQGYIVIAVSLKARDRPWEAFPYFAEASRYVPREQLALQLKQLAKQTLDTARLQNPSWKIGRLESKPSPFVPVLMGWAEAEAFFAEGGTENDTEKLYRLSSCFVPNDTLAIAMGEEQDGFIKVMIDRAFVEQLPITLAQKDQGFYCKGVVPKFIFKPILED
jgi:tetratricopeptide (TPR) repeat protein